MLRKLSLTKEFCPLIVANDKISPMLYIVRFTFHLLVLPQLAGLLSYSLMYGLLPTPEVTASIMTRRRIRNDQVNVTVHRYIAFIISLILQDTFSLEGAHSRNKSTLDALFVKDWRKITS